MKKITRQKNTIHGQWVHILNFIQQLKRYENFFFW